MDCRARSFAFVLGMLAATAAGCASPYAADRGALTGGLLGAGTGAVVGHALGNTAAGAVIGAGAGALGGAAIGAGIDESEARNRAMIEARLGRQVAPGAMAPEEAISMTRAGVEEDLIITHVRTHGLTRPLQTNDLIGLRQNGVSPRVIQAMQEPPPMPAGQPVMVQQAPPMVVQPYDPYYGYPPYYYYPPPYHHRPPPRPGWGVTVWN